MRITPLPRNQIPCVAEAASWKPISRRMPTVPVKSPTMSR